MRDPKHQVSDRHQHGHQKKGDRGARGEIAALDPGREREGRKGLRRIERPASGQDVHHRHVGEGEDDSEEDRHGQDGRHDRDSDLEERPPEARAVDRGGLRDLFGHRGAPRQHDDRRERNQPPAVDEDDRRHREVRLAEPHWCAVRFDEVQRDQDPGEDAVDRVQNPLPADRAERDRRDPRQQDQEADEASAAERLLQRDRENIRAHDHDHLRGEREDDGIPDRLVEARAVEDAPKILQTDEVKAGAADPSVAEGVEDRENERDADQSRDVEDRRQEHRRPEPTLPADGGHVRRRIATTGGTRTPFSRSKNFSRCSITAKAYTEPFSKRAPWVADNRETAFF